MLCPKCGVPVENSSRFCLSCGMALTERNKKQQPHIPPANEMTNVREKRPDTLNISKPDEPVRRPRSGGDSTAKIILVIILCMILVLIAIVGICIAISGNESDNTTKTDVISDTLQTNDNQNQSESGGTETISHDDSAQTSNQQSEPSVDVVESVNSFISSHGYSSSVAVAICDNTTGQKYMCNGSYDRYTSWGFYLPVYLVMQELYPYEFEECKSGIMSSDPAKSNLNANLAMDYFGGPDGITSSIQSSFNCTVTEYGRKFGATNSSRDNYTCAAEAVVMLNHLNNMYKYDLLCYNGSKFGVTFPS